MRLKSRYIVTGLLLLTLWAFSCRRDKKDPPVNGTSAYIQALPAYFPPYERSTVNPLTNEGVALGRMLYYDTLLSSGGPMAGRSCSSCHLQEKGFAMPGMAVLPHINLAWNRHFLWKGDVEGTMEDILRFEVDEFFASDMERLKSNPQYPALYKSAFGSGDITREKTAFALAQFMRTLVSVDSRYDKYLKNEIVLTDKEMRGYGIFFSEKGDCYHCHGSPLFSDNAYHNIGLVQKSANDMGRYRLTGNSSDVGKFKTPTLRNVALRNVYMHDGRFKTLKDVINHYDHGVQHGEYLDPLLDKPALGLTDTEIDELIAFLHTLTDSTFINNPQFSRP